MLTFDHPAGKDILWPMRIVAVLRGPPMGYNFAMQIPYANTVGAHCKPIYDYCRDEDVLNGIFDGSVGSDGGKISQSMFLGSPQFPHSEEYLGDNMPFLVQVHGGELYWVLADHYSD